MDTRELKILIGDLMIRIRELELQNQEFLRVIEESKKERKSNEELA